jgi:hypothetical protein
MTRYVAYHEEMGIYLGHCLGLGFWTLLDPVGQPCAVTFESPDELNEHLQQDFDGPVTGIHPVAVNVADPGDPPYATILECVEAGLPAWNPQTKTPAEA